MKAQKETVKSQIITKYTLIGVIFGIMFPLGAFVFEIFINNISFSLESVKIIHLNNKVLFMIDSAPLFLGIFALLGGISKSKSEISNKKISEILSCIQETSSSLYDNLQQIRLSTNQLENKENDIREISYTILNSTEEIVEMASIITEKSKIAFNESEETVKSATEANKVMKNTVLEMRNISQLVNNQADSVDKLLKHSQKVAEITGMINKISMKIKIVSLNAAIEAARAGDEGKEFGIVVNEITKLAKETSFATKEIDTLISNMFDMTEKVWSNMTQIKTEIDSETNITLKNSKEIMKILNNASKSLEESSNVLILVNNEENILKNIKAQTKQTHVLTEDMYIVLQDSKHSIKLNEDLVSELVGQASVIKTPRGKEQIMN